MRRIFAIMVTVLAFGAAMVVGVPASATPADGGTGVSTQAWWDCPDNYFCAWYSTNGNDRMFYGQSGAPDLNDFELNDHVWSVWNRTGVVWCAYPDINYSDVNGSSAAPNPWPVGNWQGNTSQYGMQGAISSLRRGAC